MVSAKQFSHETGTLRCLPKEMATYTLICLCGETQTMSHIVESCPLTKLNGGLSRLHLYHVFHGVKARQTSLTVLLTATLNIDTPVLIVDWVVLIAISTVKQTERSQMSCYMQLSCNVHVLRKCPRWVHKKWIGIKDNLCKTSKSSVCILLSKDTVPCIYAVS